MTNINQINAELRDRRLRNGTLPPERDLPSASAGPPSTTASTGPTNRSSASNPSLTVDGHHREARREPRIIPLMASRPGTTATNPTERHHVFLTGGPQASIETITERRRELEAGYEANRERLQGTVRSERVRESNTGGPTPADQVPSAEREVATADRTPTISSSDTLSSSTSHQARDNVSAEEETAHSSSGATEQARRAVEQAQQDQLAELKHQGEVQQINMDQRAERTQFAQDGMDRANTQRERAAQAAKQHIGLNERQELEYQPLSAKDGIIGVSTAVVSANQDHDQLISSLRLRYALRGQLGEPNKPVLLESCRIEITDVRRAHTYKSKEKAHVKFSQATKGMDEFSAGISVFGGLFGVGARAAFSNSREQQTSGQTHSEKETEIRKTTLREIRIPNLASHVDPEYVTAIGTALDLKTDPERLRALARIEAEWGAFIATNIDTGFTVEASAESEGKLDSTSSSSEQGYQQGGEASGLIKAIQIGGSEQSEGHYATACGRASTSGKAKAEHSKNGEADHQAIVKRYAVRPLWSLVPEHLQDRLQALPVCNKVENMQLIDWSSDESKPILIGNPVFRSADKPSSIEFAVIELVWKDEPRQPVRPATEQVKTDGWVANACWLQVDAVVLRPESGVDLTRSKWGLYHEIGPAVSLGTNFISRNKWSHKIRLGREFCSNLKYTGDRIGLAFTGCELVDRTVFTMSIELYPSACRGTLEAFEYIAADEVATLATTMAPSCDTDVPEHIFESHQFFDVIGSTDRLRKSFGHCVGRPRWEPFTRARTEFSRFPPDAISLDSARPGIFCIRRWLPYEFWDGVPRMEYGCLENMEGGKQIMTWQTASWRSALLSELAATKRQNAPVRQKLLDNTYEVLCGDTTRTKWVGDVDLRKSVPLEVEGEYDAVGRRGEDPETVPYVAAGLDKGGDPCFVARRKQDNAIGVASRLGFHAVRGALGLEPSSDEYELLTFHP